MINVVDRVSTYPGRVKITHANGTSEYVTWERADEPTVEGTPINKALFDSIAADVGLSANVTVYVSGAGSDTLGDGSSANPYKTIAKALSTLPKHLGGYHARISVGTATDNEDVVVTGIIGGHVIFTGASGASMTIKSLTVSEGSSVHMENISLGVSGSAGTAGIVVQQAQLLCFGNVFVTAAQATGVYVARNGFALFSTTLGVNNTTGIALHATSGATVYVNTLAGSSNTGISIQSSNGARVAFNSRTITATSSFLTMYGGRIYTGSQADTPNY